MKRKNAGFTLLELVVVVAVMGLISTMAMDVYTDNSNQKRFEATKQRLAEIKFAIIGDPMMRVGSRAIMKGSFFKDMKRLPVSLNELIVSPNTDNLCINEIYKITTDTSPSSCSASGTSAGKTYSWIVGDADGDSKNDDWKGPYLSTNQTDKDSSNVSYQVFRDAWGNKNSSDSNDKANFGWKFLDSTADLIITSFGLNRISGGSNYEEDKSTTIYATELANIDYLQSLEATGYCIDISDATPPIDYTIDLDFRTQGLCEDNNPTPPAVPPAPTHLWASFIQ